MKMNSFTVTFHHTQNYGATLQAYALQHYLESLGVDNKEYVTRLYKTFMGRDPEEDGFNYWMNALSNGMTRDEVFDFFSTCQEFTDICKEYSIIR